MTDTEDLTGWRMVLTTLAAIALLVAVYAAARLFLSWWTA